MRILIVQSSMSAGGISKANLNLALGFRKLGHYVSFLTYLENTKPESFDFEITSMNFKKITFIELFIALFKIRMFLKSSRPYDAVISCSELISLPVCLNRYFNDFILIMNSHTNVVEHLNRSSLLKVMLYKICKFFFKRKSILSNVSKGAVAASKVFYNTCDVYELPNPVTVWDFKRDIPDIVNFNERFIVACGSLVKNKNYELMLYSFHSLADNNLRLVIIGDGPEKESLQSLALKLSIADRVIFLGNVSEPREIMCNAELLFHTSFYEGAPMVLLEALSVGIPIVSTDFNSGAREIIGDDVYGCISKSFSIPDCALALNTCLNKEKKERSFYINKTNEYSMEECCIRYINFLSKVK